MQRRNYKYFILSVLAFFGGGLLISLAGCSDDPENAASGRVREKTEEAVQTAVAEKDYAAGQQKVIASMVSSANSKAGSSSIEAARLASGNLALAHGRQMQAALDMKTLPVRDAVTSLEKLIRYSEELLLEKERSEGILASGQQEMTELDQLLKGDAQQPGLTRQQEDVQAELDQLQEQKAQEQAQKDKTQAVLDDYQSRADALTRKAEMAQGAERLKLEKEAFAILQDRKQYYIEAQASENKIAVMDNQLQLVQRRLDGIQQSIEETGKRMDAIEGSQARLLLKQQVQEITQTLSVNQQQLVSQAAAVQNALATYQKEVEDTCDIFGEAGGELERVGSREAVFTAHLKLAESYHYAALARSGWITVQMDTAERVGDLLAAANPTLSGLLQEKLSAVIEVRADSQPVMELFDKAIETYQRALDEAAGEDAKCSVFKSKLLAVNSKMRLANFLDLSEIMEQTKQKREELMQQGQTYGVCFTQSETRKLIESGIDYAPSLPINMQVLAEDLEKRFTAWKRLPVAEQETAVAANLVEIDELINRYGETLAEELEPLKQEMLDAQNRGFKEVTPQAGAAPAGIGEPNAF